MSIASESLIITEWRQECRAPTYAYDGTGMIISVCYGEPTALVMTLTGRAIHPPIGVATLEDWFVQHYLPTLSPSRAAEIMARLAARRMGGNLPGPLSQPTESSP